MDLLTGSTGYLGRHLARRLSEQGRRLRALVRPGTDLKRIPPQIEDVVWGDFEDPEALACATDAIDTVFHAAARVAAGGSRTAFTADNVEATEALLDAAAAAGVRRLVHVSSAGIYGASSADALIDEAAPLDPAIEQRGAYAWSKAEADRRVRAAAAAGRIAAVVVRPGILYGAEQRPFLARLQFPVPRAHGKRIVVGSRATLIPLTHVANACDAIALAAVRGRPGAAYNVVDGQITQGEYLELLARHGVVAVDPIFVHPAWLVPVALACELAGRLTGRTLPLTRYRLRRATESLRYDTSAARADLGWSPGVDLDAGVRSMLAERFGATQEGHAP